MNNIKNFSVVGFGVLIVLSIGLDRVAAKPLINEIYYSPQRTTAAEDIGAEWIEIYNSGVDVIDLEGWRLSSGVSFVFPKQMIPAGGFIVVAADPDKFLLNYPDHSKVLGPWEGRLSNSGETIRLRDNNGNEVDQVDYANEGDWAIRSLGPNDRGHQGWVWIASHNGGGKSLELINSKLSNKNGQNWKGSLVEGGTPASINSVLDENIAPLVKKFGHSPLIPNSSDPVKVTFEVENSDSFSELEATLFWRVDSGEEDYLSINMVFDGKEQFYAQIPPQKNKSVIEFYVVISDGEVSRSWPAEVEGGGNLCNPLYQIDDDFISDEVQFNYFVVMRESERKELEDIGTNNNQSQSNAEMNCTFISIDGKNSRVRYLAAIRNRGAGSRSGPPNNQLVKFRSDDRWNGLESIKFNCRYTHSQVAGSWLYQWLGVEAADSIPVKLRINGQDLAESGGPRMFGSYARTESLDSEFTAEHWPNDPNGNLYQVRDDEDSGEEGDLKYEGDDPESYQDTYFKKTNKTVDDWSDLIALTQALNSEDDNTYFDRISEIVDVDQWLHFLAVDSLLGNREGGLTTGKGDDYALYRGNFDPRFKLVPHDLDTVLDQGTRGGSPNLSIFTYSGVDGLEEFLSHPDIVPLFYAEFLDLLESRFKPELINPIIDRAVGGYASANAVREMKDFVVDRREGVLGQIPVSYSVEADLPISVEGYFKTLTGQVTFSGRFHAAKIRSVTVNGAVADMDARSGTWELRVPAGGGGVLFPGLNRISVKFHDARNSEGKILREEYIRVWNDTGKLNQVSGEQTGNGSQGFLNLTTRDTYLPGVPFLVRVDLQDSNGSYARDVWDAAVSLSSNVPGISVSPSVVELRNGLGSALISVGGGGEERTVTVIREGSVWKYLDDGSDQGSLWTGVDFDDSAWKSGPAQLGYGDGDEDTELSFGPDSRDKYATTYFRSDFTVDDVESIIAVDMRLRCDDGAIVYLNGKEFFITSNMESGMAYNEYTVDGDDAPTENFQEFNRLSPSLLVSGTNTIAVEIKQGDERSSDISFDLGLIIRSATSSVDPGDFGLIASLGGQSEVKDISSLSAQPDTLEVSGVLVGAETQWSGVIRVTGDVTVPDGHVLNVLPGTLILIEGDSVPRSSSGNDIIVRGTISCLGTETQPISFTAAQSNQIWGELLFDQAEKATFRFTNIHRAGHSPSGGHTNHGRVLRILGSRITFEDCSISDNRGKIGQAEAINGTGSDLLFRRCHWARSVMGIETFNTGVLMEDCFITDMLGIYREDDVTDDNDAIYLHSAGPGQSLTLRRLTVAYMDDDGIDTLEADVTMLNVISRNCADKGASIFNGSANILSGLFVENGIGISAKDDAVVVMNQVTLAANQSIGVQAENKDGGDARSYYTISNSVIWGNQQSIRTDYERSDINVLNSIVEGGWDGELAQDLDPLFRSANSKDFRLGNGSPAIGLGREENEIGDAGFYPFVEIEGEVRWSALSGPYHVTGDVIIPSGVTFVVEPGVSVFFDEGTRIRIEGKAIIAGEPEKRIQFSHLPGTSYEPNPAGNGELPDAPPKWEGLKIVDSMDPANIISHVDVVSAQHDNGSIGIIRSQCVIDDVSFRRTHIRMLYTEDASILLQNCIFPDMFSESENPAALGLDNISEHVKGIGVIPDGGRYIIKNNFFGRNKGHNDVMDVDSGWRPDPILQIIGNRFAGAGDELCDLGGDVYLAENIFYNVFKNDETSDHGYANAISTGDVGPGATISVARNIFWDVDHAISLKIGTSTIFENNTVHKIHPDFIDKFDNPSVASVVNLFVPTDTDSRATHGGGVYAADNIIEAPRLFSGADDAKEPPYPVTPLELFRNLIEPAIEDLTIGRNHAGKTILDLGSDNQFASPLYADPSVGDFTLLPNSPAIGAGNFGQDLGYHIPSGILISGEPDAITTLNEVTLRVGGPGIFGYRWRLNGGNWSEDLEIGNGFNPPEPTIRSAEIIFSDLPEGSYLVEVIGQDFAGEWQTAPSFSKQWTVVKEIPKTLFLNELLVLNRSAYESDGQFPGYIELHNPGSSNFILSGITISDDLDEPGKFAFGVEEVVPAGGFFLVEFGKMGIDFDLDGNAEIINLYRFGEQIDSIEFGLQAEDLSVGRVGRDRRWTLNVPTPGQKNRSHVIGNSNSVRISEWLANPGVAFADEFIELQNRNPLPVEISGMRVTDNPVSDVESMILPPLSFISGTGYVVIEPKGFKLSADLDQIALLNSDGSLQDSLIYGSQLEDRSEGLNSKGESYQKFRLPTPGIGAPAEGSIDYTRALEIFDSLRITEIMYNPLGGSDFEYIELENIGDIPVDLNGVRFTDGIDFEFNELLLGPNQKVLVVANVDSFHSRYGDELNVAGTYAGRLNNAGEGLVVQLPDPFSAAIIRFSFDDNWRPDTDGKGASLELLSTEIELSNYGDGSSWSSSGHLGSPGESSLNVSYSSWAENFKAGHPDSDEDADGIPNALEFALGTDPFAFDHTSNPILIQELEMLEWKIESDLRAEGVRIVFEFSDDLNEWVEMLPSLIETSALTVRYVLRIPISEGRKFFRIGVSGL